MARKAGQLIARGPRTWLVRVSLGRDRETGTRKYYNKTVRGSCREAQALSIAKKASTDVQLSGVDCLSAAAFFSRLQTRPPIPSCNRRQMIRTEAKQQVFSC